MVKMKQWKVIRVAVGVALAGYGLIALFWAIAPAVTAIDLRCGGSETPAGALRGEGPNAVPQARGGWWPLGVECTYAAADGGDPITVAPSWDSTTAAASVAILGLGVLLVRGSPQQAAGTGDAIAPEGEKPPGR